MNRSRPDPMRMVLSVGISMLMLTLSVAVPLLEQGAILDHPVVENEHNPGDCPSGHDHTICTQVGANLAIASEQVASPLGRTVTVVSPVTGARTLLSGSTYEANPSRAPPLA